MQKNVHIGEYNDYRKMCERLLSEAIDDPGTVFGAYYGAWSVCFSQSDGLGKIFSASVRKKQTKERDWRIIGVISAIMGAPEASMPESIFTAPDATHYWCWDTPDGAKTKLAEVIKRLTKAREPN